MDVEYRAVSAKVSSKGICVGKRTSSRVYKKSTTFSVETVGLHIGGMWKIGLVLPPRPHPNSFSPSPLPLQPLQEKSVYWLLHHISSCKTSKKKSSQGCEHCV
jgi:hypothetical protein